ncbi:MAG: bifunctional diaminohydroxyphosphoribosylaminopyrimidine deaminase/5-amino-6-(5-phosphoribosylamino)uracil reductase RibD, partial [Rhodobacteraceae bacterium]|nr:bifunctional diaminohydroxyphosphoribosylaminopyrimidine deaminase/5-amino-6-(5-phosphoribosylamino)uracil reductase RibD [Paracoccaceae bacterium]
MSLALALGRRGLGRVWPNPAVGCVIVREGRIVGRGRTADGGRPHAETVALAEAGAAAEGATAYVSLEPCAHHGQTPPCAEALIAAGVARVVTALEDPDPRVAGRGHAMLRAAAIAVTTGVMEPEARAGQQGFLTRVRLGRPMLTLKLAASLDGRIATASGESRWITGPEARRRVHAMRATHDAVLVGAGTARADDPELTVRGLGPTPMPQPVPQPVRVVAARGLDLPRGGKLAKTIAEAPLWLLHGSGAPSAARADWQALGARLIVADEGPDG